MTRPKDAPVDEAPTLVRPLQANTAVAIDPTLRALSSAAALIGSDSLDAPLPSERAARYAFRKTLGVGGMGEVRLCHDSLIGREIALKVMRQNDLDAATRFVREARVQGQLEHPSVVPVYDLGRDEQGALFFTMKRIRGMTLEEAIRPTNEDAPRPSQRRLLNAFVSVCLAVEFAHSRGVLHRDLKPSNVMLGEFGEVNVLDWGIAKVLGTSVAGTPTESEPVLDLDGPNNGKTVAGSLVGTPGYMSPEQASGEVEKIDARSDVYSLGAILYEIVTGEHLHTGSSVTAILASTLQGPADPRPSAKKPDVAPEIDAICMKALATKPDDRYASARELCDALEHFLDGDRDLTLRREMAEEHLLRAREAKSHTVALQEAFRALALRPDDGEGRALVAKLLLEAPAEVPKEARAELDTLEAQARRQGSLAAARRYLTWLVFIPLVVLMGVRSWTFVFTAIALLIASTLASLQVARLPKPTLGHGLLVLVLSMSTASSVSTLFGPFVIVPALAATNALLFSLYAERRGRLAVALAGSIAVIVPFVLELVGVLPPSMGQGEGGVTLFARAVSIAPRTTELFLLATSIGILITTTLTVGRVRDELTASERKSFLQAWHLRKMIE